MEHHTVMAMTENKLPGDGKEMKHICGMFRDSTRQIESAADFITEGIRNGEKALIVGTQSWLGQLTLQLERKLPQVLPKIEGKAIEFFEPRETYLAGGSFSVERMLCLLDKQSHQALMNGFRGVRGVGEMSWALKAFDVWEKLFAYEAQVNDFVQERQYKAYCLYDLTQFPAKQLYRVLLTHPHLENDIYRGVCPNHVSTKEFLQEQWKSHFDSSDLNRTSKQYIVVEQKPSEDQNSPTSQITDSIKDPILLISSKGEIRYMNEGARKRYGNQVNRICHDSIFKDISPCPICELVKLAGQGREKIETEIKDVKGAHLNLSAHIISEGEYRNCMVIYLRDVTQRRKWEEEAAFMDKFSSLGYLSSGIAHELNNNLTPIMIYSQMLGQSDLPDSVRQKAQRIEVCASASKRLVESLTDFSQKIPHKLDFANLNSTIQKTIDLMEYRLSTAKIEVVLNLDPSLPSILVDELKIQQVFSNIITNAYQAMQEKGGRITLSSSQSKGWCRFEIADTGPGIPKEIRSKIFDPFFTTRQIGEAKGLGLSTSFGIVAAHQGKICFESQENVGTTFVVELPVVGSPDANLVDGSPRQPFATLVPVS